MMNQVLKFGESDNAILVNGKCVLYKVTLDGKTNRMTVARKMFEEYPKHFSSIADVMAMIRTYEKTDDFIWNDKCAYILHQA